ncbi:PAS domain-containing sensor histidine kinase [Ancylomarina salipaludis]|uniref:histidine kinase n=1 Tax=Ancylomarina salipaludis TaxID=2501299 RepID=A0A4Q1JMY5_9BACT|nr:PAS domain-containing sensor histidine kinase [Ancylomarina salipaludis]RXQ95058.1 PAS domain-containing sensor histidine kinase [Ancylomarina salipaludis]
MELKTDLYKVEKIQELENEIFELKQRLNKTEAGLPCKSILNEDQKLVEGFGVIDHNFNILSFDAKSNSFRKNKDDRSSGQKCYSVFCNSNEPCAGCTILKKRASKLVWYSLQTQLPDNQRKCKKNIIASFESNEPNAPFLVETDLFYQQLFESKGDALLILNCKGQVLKFTDKLNEMLGYSKEEFSKLTVFDIDDPTNSLTFEERVSQVRETKGAIFETDLITKSGDLIPVESSLCPIKYHDKTVYFTSFRNIQERKETERELHESEIRFRTLVENATDLVMRFDREYRYVFINSASLHVFGIPPEDFIGKTHHDMGFPYDLCQLCEEEMDKVFESGISDVIDFSIEVKGREISFEWQLIPEFDEEDEIPYLMAVARDVTKRKQSEKALEEALKTKDKFFSIIAHDLKNPFGSLRALSEALQLNDDLTKEEINEFAEIIHASACQGYDLLENLLDWSRSQRGNIKCEPEEFDLIELVESNINLLQANIHKKKINIHFNPDHNKTVFADKYMVDTIIRNLMANAVKFTYMYGNIEISLLDREKHYGLSIKDDGKGISQENQTKLFDMDNQYSSKGTAMETGTGLGLILCKEFIDCNNGEIWVESENGEGSCFSFIVPKNKSGFTS